MFEKDTTCKDAPPSASPSDTPLFFAGAFGNHFPSTKLAALESCFVLKNPYGMHQLRFPFPLDRQGSNPKDQGRADSLLSLRCGQSACAKDLGLNPLNV